MHTTRALSKTLLLPLLLGLHVSVIAQPPRQNPLLTGINVPIDFKAISVTDIADATTRSLTDARKLLQEIEALPTGKHSYRNTVLAYDDLAGALERVQGRLYILSNASPDSALRNTAQRNLQEFSRFGNELALDEQLYRAFKDVAGTSEGRALTGWKQKFVRETIDDFERNGFALTAEKRRELERVNNRIDSLSLLFGQNIAEYKDQLLLSEADMKGLPEDFIKARKKQGDQYIITLDGPSYTTFMKYAESDAARRELYKKYMNRAADKNLTVLQQLLVERRKKAKLLGFESYGAYRTSDRMVKNSKTVWDFENDLVEKIREKSKKDLEELLTIKRAYLKDPQVKTIDAWESSFYNNLLMKQKYALDAQEVQEYLSLDNVIRGLFNCTQQLFGIRYEEVKDASVWHPDVRTFDVLQQGNKIGRFYLDLFPRDNKYTHAACFPITPGKAYGSEYQQPVAALLCNFNAPTADKPALLTHAQAVTFFHEFGHVLHNMLTQAELASQSGTSVKRDFVEAPSQIFENWVWNYDVLKGFARHYKTGAVLPQELFQKMTNARNVGSGIAAAMQVSYGMVDMTLHDRFDPEGSQSTTDVVREVSNRVTPFAYVEGTNFQAAFGHLTGYGASYYGYMWSKVYAEDMFSIFAKEGVLNPATGKRYRSSILARGGTRDEFDMVQEFLGRKPNTQAFFRSLGL
jgi:thimet oligopeptidase